MARTPERTPAWLLERIALEELPPEQLARARERLIAEPGGATRLAALEQSNCELLAAHPPEHVAAEVQRRAHLLRVQDARRRDLRGPALWAGLPLTAALAALVLMWLGEPRGLTDMLGRSGTDTRSSYDGIKGDARLVVHRQTATAPERLSDGARAHTGDTLQLGYVSAGARFGVIVSVDGRGTVTLHMPEAGGRAASLEPGTSGAAVALPSAYQLDDAPRFERFFLVTASTPFDVAVVRDAAERLAASQSGRSGGLALPVGLKQTSLLVEKTVP